MARRGEMSIHPKHVVLCCATALLVTAAPAHALRVATWNLLQYGYNNQTSTLTARQADFRTVMAALSPDVLICQELDAPMAKDSFQINVLNVVEPGQWTGQIVDVLGGEGMCIFWKPAVAAVSSISAVSTGGPRKVMQCLVKPVGYLTSPGWFRLYSIHLKAGGPATVDSSTRRIECTYIRSSILNPDQPLAGPNFLIGGDSNFYSANEGGYIRLTESQTNNYGRCKDYLLMPGNWHQNSGYLLYHTQCACNLTGCLTDRGVTFSGGGLDDRFDWLMTSSSVQDGTGFDLAGYTTFGQDGAHYNQSINDGGFNYAVGYTVATALKNTSDHIPVVAVLRLPAKISAASQLAFGTVITGATAELPLAVTNLAPQPIGYTVSGSAPLTLPGDTLRYSLAAPADFTAPGGTLLQPAGAAPTSQTIAMSTASAGAKSGTLTLATNDPDTLSKSVLLSGTVLRHAAASLDSLSVVLAATLDLGQRLAGDYPDTTVRVFDQGYDALQARLAVSAGAITGGDGRFSLVGGFQAALVAGAPAAYAIRFDAVGATLDSTYEATLTLSSADEALPGAQAQPDLVVTLRAHPTYEGAGVPVGLPTALRFYPPRPNPAAGAIRFAYDLPRSAPVRLEVFDLSGRRVASVVSGQVEAGHHELRWSPREGDAGVTAGLYFARFSVPGMTRMVRVVLLP
jgi:hypothetical protein